MWRKNRSVFRRWTAARSWIGYHLGPTRRRLLSALPAVRCNGEPKRMAARDRGELAVGGLGERTTRGGGPLSWTYGGVRHLTGLGGTWRTRGSGYSGSNRWRPGGRKRLVGGSECRGKRWRCGQPMSCCPRVCRRQASQPWGQLDAVLETNRPWQPSSTVTLRSALVLPTPPSNEWKGAMCLDVRSRFLVHR